MSWVNDDYTSTLAIVSTAELLSAPGAKVVLVVRFAAPFVFCSTLLYKVDTSPCTEVVGVLSSL